MINTVTLDVLVVYSSDTAKSASVEDAQSKHPFLLTSKAANYNLSYAYFLQRCEKKGLMAGFTTSADIIGPGKCKSFWTFSSGKWKKMHKSAESTYIFDKVSPTSPKKAQARQLLLSSKKVRSFNNVELLDLFSDKHLTYKKLSAYSIPTTVLRSQKVLDIENAIEKLRTIIHSHPHSADFSSQIILKDRFGAGGNHVYKIDHNFVQEINAVMTKNPRIRFIIQPFLAFDKGFLYKNRRTSTDIRLIVHNNTVLQCYIRMAKKTDFRCNEHQGGQLEYVTQKDIPNSIHIVSQEIIKKLNKPVSLFAIDFVISNSGRPYFLEGNINPGLDWDINKKLNEKMSKELIRSIVDSIASGIHKFKLPTKFLPLPQYSPLLFSGHPTYLS